MGLYSSAESSVCHSSRQVIAELTVCCSVVQRPQNLAVHLTLVQKADGQNAPPISTKVEAYVGWTGMASASSLAHFQASQAQAGDVGFETIEIDPQFCQGLGLAQGDIVRACLYSRSLSYSRATNTSRLRLDSCMTSAWRNQLLPNRLHLTIGRSS